MSSRRSGGGPSATQQPRMSFNQPGGGKDTHAFILKDTPGLLKYLTKWLVFTNFNSRVFVLHYFVAGGLFSNCINDFFPILRNIVKLNNHMTNRAVLTVKKYSAFTLDFYHTLPTYYKLNFRICIL